MKVYHCGKGNFAIGMLILPSVFGILLHGLIAGYIMGDFIFPLKPSFKLGFKPNFGLKPN